jgi:pimeloyl-ACP methyl ester carboxylesterase
MNETLLLKFCTPPSIPLAEHDVRAIADAERVWFDFEGDRLEGYGWGEGRAVLLLHGWGSRASHLAHIGRAFAKKGYRSVAFDAPAHTSTGRVLKKSTSSMFEYGRAVSAVAKALGSLHAVVGHSLGAISAVFGSAGFKMFADYRISAEKMALLSIPPTLADILGSFCRQHGLNEGEAVELKQSLEEGFSFSVEDYEVRRVLPEVRAKLLFVHDAQDEEFPIDGIRALNRAFPGSELFETEGSGHQRILMNRSMLRRVQEFLKDPQKG